jgi:hypothetical protein
MIVEAPWYVPITVIRRDLQAPTVNEEIRSYSSQYSSRLNAHPNDLIVTNNQYILVRGFLVFFLRKCEKCKNLNGF